MLKPPCSYQGGKQRLSKQIVDYIFDHEFITNRTKFYDLCCGSGAITVELINRGIQPQNIIMLDVSSWGLFWQQIGNGTFQKEKWEGYCEKVPKDKNKIQNFMIELSKESAEIDESYKYLLLQSASFGGKQIWKKDDAWCNTSFRNYWQPTATSKRHSPVNPTQPSILELKNRVNEIITDCKGITCIHNDITAIYSILETDISSDSIIYLDPPYSKTTSYGYSFNLEEILSNLFDVTLRPIYVSEKEPIAEESYKLNFTSKKGGISGNKSAEREEYLNVFR